MEHLRSSWLARRLTWFAEALIQSDLPPAAAAFLVYLRTLAPGVYGYDSAELATGAYTLGIVHPTGYPLFLLLARGFTFLPVGSVAYRVNLASAVFGALTIWAVARLVREVTGRRAAAWLAALALAYGYAFWSMAVVAEVYTLHTLLAALLLFQAQRLWKSRRARDLYLLAFLCGISLTNHVSTAFLLPGMAWVAWRSVGARRLLRRAPVLLGLFALGLTPYLYLPLRDLADPPLNYVRDYYGVNLQSLSGLWWMMSGQAYRFFAFGYDLAGYLRELLGFVDALWRQYTGLGLALGLLGAARLLRKSPLGPAAATAFLAFGGFFAGYAVADKGTMFLPAHLIWALWLGVGLADLEGLVARHPRLRARAGLWRKGAAAAVALMVLLMVPANWRWADKSEVYGPEVVARQVLSTVEPGAVILGDWSTAVVLEYLQQVEGMRPDVIVVNRSRYAVAQYYRLWSQGVPHEQAIAEIHRLERQMVWQQAQTHPVYSLDYDPLLATEFEYQPVGTVFQLVPHGAGG